MAGKRTFQSIRVHGILRADGELHQQGIVRISYLECIQRLVWQESISNFEVTTFHNHWGALNWEHATAGQWSADTGMITGAENFYCHAIPPFVDDDGDLIFPLLFAGNDHNTGKLIIELTFSMLDGTWKDPPSFSVTVRFKAYK